MKKESCGVGIRTFRTLGLVQIVADIWMIGVFVLPAAGSVNAGYIIGEGKLRLAELERLSDELIPGGGPPFDSAEELEEVLERYFAEVKDKGDPPTLSGLSVVMDWGRASILSFSDESHPLFKVIQKARRRCREYAEKYAYTGKNQVCGIFMLKANWGIQDTQRIEHIGEGGGPLLLINRQPRQITGGEVVEAELEEDDPLAL